MNPELQAYVDRHADPKLIPGIHNYCHRWCERCPFTERCAVFCDIREYETQHPEAGILDQVHDAFQKTFEMLKAKCEEDGVNFETLRREADSPEARAELERVDAAIDAEPLMKRAKAYTQAAFALVKSLERAAAFRLWPQAVYEAIDTIGWYCGMVSVKVHRALRGIAQLEDNLEWDPVQNDWNGSAKVAKLAVAEARTAWKTILQVGEAPADSPIRQVITLLDQIEAGIDERFPRVMEFVRPGFDEPEVAAGVLTTLAPFEPRSR